MNMFASSFRTGVLEYTGTLKLEGSPFQPTFILWPGAYNVQFQKVRLSIPHPPAEHSGMLKLVVGGRLAFPLHMHWPAKHGGTLKMEKDHPVGPAEDSRTLKLEKVCLSIPQRPAEHRKTLKFEKILLSISQWLTENSRTFKLEKVCLSISRWLTENSRTLKLQ